jgi:hypothetical protein
MNLTPYVDELQRHLVATAELGGDEARDLASRLAPHLDAMVRLVLLDALSAAADEITTELAPGSVAVRVRGREPEFEVSAPPTSVTSDDVSPTPQTAATRSDATSDLDDGEIARITLRLSEVLKGRVEQAAGAERLSVNAWLVRAVADALDHRGTTGRTASTTPVAGQRLSGWAH